MKRPSKPVSRPPAAGDIPRASSKSSQSQPRHADLSDELASAIASGAFPVGERFPTEFDLQERFGVGRHTVREALKTLTDQGLLVRKRKVGTTVVVDRPQTKYSHLIRDIRGLLDFSGDTLFTVAHIGMVIPAAATLGDYFAELGDSRWLRIAGTRYAKNDNMPLSWSEIFIPEQFPLDRKKVLEAQPIYEYCQAEHGLKLDHVEQEIRGGILPAKISQLLGADKDGASLIVVRRYFDQIGRIFEVSLNVYAADRYSVKSVIRQKA